MRFFKWTIVTTKEYERLRFIRSYADMLQKEYDTLVPDLKFRKELWTNLRHHLILYDEKIVDTKED